MKYSYAVLIMFFLSNTLAAQSDAAWDHYWNAGNLSSKQKAAKEILSSNPTFDDVYAKLKQGKKYPSDVKRGFFTWDRTLPNGLELYALLFVPHDYDPSKKYPVRIFLHGAVSNVDPHYVMKWIDTTNATYHSVEQIRIYPSGYSLAHWFENIQYDNIMHLLDSVKQLYNVDENEVSLGGASDGGSGTYLFANSNLTPFCCLLPFISDPGILNYWSKRNVYLNNFSNLPMFIVNGGKDQIYPASDVLPYVNQIMRINAATSFILIDSSGHSLSWLAALNDTINHFISAHPRNPYPDHLFWQTPGDKKFNRNSWVMIDEIGKSGSNSMEISDLNSILKNGADQVAFKRDTLFGIIDVQRKENVITVRTKNVEAYTLLLSPDQFDFSQPIKIITNDQMSFEGMINKDVSTLLKWNAIDDDRTMLYAAEIKIKPGKELKKK